MTFLNSHKHHSGMTGGYLSLVTMPWVQTIAKVQNCTRRLQSVVVEVKTNWEVRLT